MPDAVEAAEALIKDLRERCPGTDFVAVGSLRRGCETCGDWTFWPSGNAPEVMGAFTSYRLVDRILGQGDTKSSVLLWGGLQADLRLVPRASRARPASTSRARRATISPCATGRIARGYKLNEYGLFRIADDAGVAGEDEEGIYEALGLRFIPPELREARGEIEAAESGSLPALIDAGLIRGDLHTHTTETDGRDDIEAMAHAARAAGLDYIAITDHSRALAMANGLDERRALEHARRIREVGARTEGITLLAGIECDIRPDGSMDLADDCLAQLDLVIASVHSAFNQDEAQMTQRLQRAVECPSWTSSATRQGGCSFAGSLTTSTSSVWSTRPSVTGWRSRSTARSIGWISTTSMRDWLASVEPGSSSVPTRTAGPASAFCAGAPSWPGGHG